MDSRLRGNDRKGAKREKRGLTLSPFDCAQDDPLGQGFDLQDLFGCRTLLQN